MKRLLLILVAAFALAIPASGTAKPVSPYVTCTGSCTGGGAPPYPCDYWHYNQTIFWNGYFWTCSTNGRWYFDG